MTTVDSATFYQQALQWKHHQEEAERQAGVERGQEINAEWKKIADLIREALPIQGMTIHETIRGEFSELPRKGITYSVDCQIDPTRRELMQMPPINGRSMCGVIRVTVEGGYQEGQTVWHIDGYEVWLKGECTRFENPNEAFIAAYEGMQVQ
jgi:hypothetical protein